MVVIIIIRPFSCHSSSGLVVQRLGSRSAGLGLVQDTPCAEVSAGFVSAASES